MNFKRARSEEQKQIRIDQIITSTLELLETRSIDEITLKAVAEKLDFSRINLYKYVCTKEEIYLLIIAKDVEIWSQDLMEVYSQYEEISIEEFSLLWSKTLYHHKRLIKFSTLLSAVIEKKTSLESLVSFKKSIYSDVNRVIPTIERLLTDLPKQSIQEFLLFQLQYACGLYSSTDITQLQKKALELSGIPPIEIEFVPQLAKILSIVLQGLCEKK